MRSLGLLCALCACAPTRPLVMQVSDCQVAIFARVPNYPRVDLRRVKLSCSGEVECTKALRKLACEIGGDTVYALEPSQSPFRGGFSSDPTARRALRAVIARRVERPRVGGPVGWAARDFRGESGYKCKPNCGAGYRCERGQCRAVCEPACGQRRRCDADRVCRAKQRNKP